MPAQGPLASPEQHRKKSIPKIFHRLIIFRNLVNLLVLNIESVPAMESLDDILSVEGLDSVLIGPHDLSCSLGIPEQYDHPEFLKACETIFATARKHQVGAGIHFMGDVKEQLRFLEFGANMLIHSSDIVLATKHLKNDLAEIRRAVGEEAILRERRRPGTQAPSCQMIGMPNRPYHRFCPRLTA